MEEFWSGEVESVEFETEQLESLTIENMELGQFASIGMVAGGTALIVSLLVVEILSILRIR